MVNEETPPDGRARMDLDPGQGARGLRNPAGQQPQFRLPLLERAVIGLNAIGSLWVLVLVLLICADSFGRSFFSAPIEGVVEMVAVSMAVIVFCQLADTIRLGRLTRSDTLIPFFATNRVPGGRAILAAFDLLGAIVMMMIIYGMSPLVIESYNRGYYLGNRGLFTFPEWPLQAIVVIGAAAALLCFLMRAVNAWRSGSY
jgi:TRAP-type mannitol/chloroaromatic compound transport system permease small subunit